MHIYRIIYTILAVFTLQAAHAQGVLRATVLDKDTREPIIGATIHDAVKGKPIAVTDAEGCFTIPNNDDTKQIRITYIGYKILTTAPVRNGRYLLEAEISRLGEVVVTAQESRGLTSASTIGKHAMEHLQPSSFADLLELLPGGRAETPSLSTPNVIHIREAASGGSQYMTSSLGTQFMVDGAPISTNANMQYVSGAWDSESTYRDFTNAGVDMRSLSTDDIEKVEIVRGIASVEYGDLTSGLVKIERKKGTAWTQYGPENLMPVIELNGHLATGEQLMAAGKYVIAEVDSIDGDVADLIVKGLDSQKRAVIFEDGKLMIEIVGMRDPTVITWSGVAGNTWDVGDTYNFAIGTEQESTTFVSGDEVTFNDEAKTKSVRIMTDVYPAKVTVNSTSSYTFLGDGAICGTAELVKENKGMLTMKNENTYTGGNRLSGGSKC